jgi:L-ascorbate metabolism protein UlaG (beta-lactamase superfamily)
VKITYIGHAKALFEVGGVSLITDPSFSEPLYCNTLWHYPPLAVRLEDLPALDFIYISHQHRDHFDPFSLQKLNKSAQVIMPALDEQWGPMVSSMSHKKFHETMKKLGFKQTHVLGAWESMKLAPDVTATMVPALTQEPDSSLIIEAEGLTVFIQNDNYLGDPVKAELVRRFPSIDVGLMFWAGGVGYPAVFDFPDRVKMQEAWRRKYEYFFPKALETLALLRPKLFIPFANDLAWLAPDDLWINRLCKIHPGQFLEYFNRHPIHGITPMQMNSGDVWTPEDGLIRLKPEPDWDHYYEELESYAKHIEDQIRPILEDERKVDTSSLPELFKIRMTRICEDTRDIIKTLGRLTVYFQVEGSNPGDYYITFKDGDFSIGDQYPHSGWQIRLTIDDF